MVTEIGSPSKPIELDLVPEAPNVTRYRPDMVIGIAGIVVTIVVVAILWGLTHSNHSKLANQAKAHETIYNSSSAIADGAPRTYADLAEMQRRKQEEQEGQDSTIPEPNNASPASSTDLQSDYANVPEAVQTQIPGQPAQLKEDAAGSASSMFFRQDPNILALTSVVTPTTAASTMHTDQVVARETSLYGDQPIPAEGQGGFTAQKNSFIANESQSSKDYVSRPLQSPVSAFEVQAGFVISAALLTAINSDLPGEIIAQVTEPVYDSPTGQHLLVPQGARLIGKYDSLVSYGQSRALVLWNRLILPNGKSIALEGMPGVDEAGNAGLEGDVDHHRLELLGAIAFSTVLDVGPSMAQSLSQAGTTNIYTQPVSQLGSQTSQMGNNLLQRELNRPNTITIRQGVPLRILLNKDIILEEYKQQ